MSFRKLSHQPVASHWIKEPKRQLRGLRKLDKESMSARELAQGYNENHVKLIRLLYGFLVLRTDKQLELSFILEKKYSEFNEADVSYYLRCKISFPGAHDRLYQLRGNVLNTFHLAYVNNTIMCTFPPNDVYAKFSLKSLSTKVINKLPKVFVIINNNETFNAIFDFLKINFTEPVESEKFYIKRKYAKDEKIITKSFTFKRAIANLEIMSLVCKLLNFYPDFSNEKITKTEDFFGL